MIDLKLIRDETDRVRQAIADKHMNVDLDRILELDQRRRAIETDYNALRFEQKQAGEKMAKADKAEKGMLGKQLKEMKDQLQAFDKERDAIEPELRELMLCMPQIPHPDAPRGKNADDNVEVRKHGTPKPKSDYGAIFRDHVELGELLNLFDMERGVKLAGSRNYVLSGAGSMLHEAVLRLAWDIMLKAGYTPLTVPVLVNDKLMEGTGFFPAHEEEAYRCERDEMSLVGTAEVPVTGLHGEEILDAESLPKRFFARSTCFRREAGAAGRDTRGLYRVHFFDKIEQVVICPADPTIAAELHQEIMSNSEAVLQALDLPYRLVECCTGDMGQGKHRMFDFETWMPSREAYSETHSASSFHDFQARRLGLRYRDPESGKPEYCFTLNNTVVASPRILIPLIEQYQNLDGSVTVPEALRQYMNGMDRIG